ncbi:MAG: hypothetical protein WC356_01875 [Candidatus Micrarchaeia archaeon]|jgi:hypothetical protein
MKNIIFSDVNFDYPNCGGIEITKGKKYYTLQHFSNFIGNYTCDIYHFKPINPAMLESGQEIADKWYNIGADCFKQIKRGFKVQ